MRIALVEDTDSKATRIEELTSGHFPAAEIVRARSFKSGLECVRSSDFTCLLLDMTLPTYDKGAAEPGGPTQEIGGLLLLRNLRKLRRLCPTIVITQFVEFAVGDDELKLAELRAVLSTEFKGCVQGVLFYEVHPGSAWEKELVRLLEGIWCNHEDTVD